jgi:hypothetical protein
VSGFKFTEFRLTIIHAQTFTHLNDVLSKINVFPLEARYLTTSKSKRSSREDGREEIVLSANLRKSGVFLQLSFVTKTKKFEPLAKF